MRRRLNPKRVTWASDVNLCQVRLFLSEDTPSQVGLGAQDHLQAKSSWMSPSSGTSSDDNLPPGFDGAQASSLWKTKIAQIPLIKWQLPTRFILQPNWQVVAGEESQEVEAQRQREMRVLEAIYPRPSAIPLNPSLPTENFDQNNQHTPLIPITPIEDEDATDTFDTSTLNTNLVPSGVSNNHMMNGIPSTGASSSSEPDVLAVAQAALSTIMANDQANLIDRELLMKILGDPQIIGQLVRHHGGNTTSISTSTSTPMNVHNVPNQRPPGFGFSNQTPTPPPMLGPPIRMGGPDGPAPPNMRAPFPSSASSSSTGALPKDLSYYKSLIQQHGGERPDMVGPQQQQFNNRSNHHIDPNQEMQNNNLRSRESKPKIMKPCIYFNSSRGCRHGVNCAYLHDAPAQQRVNSLPEVQNAKRMKMDREITGT